MDCIDESTNTTVYLRPLAANDLLRWHEVGPDATRGYFLFGWAAYDRDHPRDRLRRKLRSGFVVLRQRRRAGHHSAQTVA